MPIRPENRTRYPHNWKQISGSVRERAGNRCENCRAPQYGVGYYQGEQFLLESGNFFWDVMEYAWNYKTARRACDDLNSCLDSNEPRRIVIVLTVAHLDHMPEHCDPANLRCWCQRCHLRYDIKHHGQTARATRRAALNNLELFQES